MRSRATLTARSRPLCKQRAEGRIRTAFIPCEKTVGSKKEVGALFNKILIANRGDRGADRPCLPKSWDPQRGCLFQGIAKSLHVQLADQRICIGEGPAKNSYLNMDRIITAAKNMGADAIHPGYGFFGEQRICPQMYRERHYLHRPGCGCDRQNGK